MNKCIKSIVVGFLTLVASQISFAQGKAGSSNSWAGSVYIIDKGIVKKNPSCDLIDPVSVYQRISNVNDINYVCYTDGSEYYQYIGRAGDGSVEFEIGLEDNFDGTWYGYVFEYKPGADGALPDELYRYDLSNDQVQSCRAAFEPPFC
jgi:hypothetical protein